MAMFRIIETDGFNPAYTEYFHECNTLRQAKKQAEKDQQYKSYVIYLYQDGVHVSTRSLGEWFDKTN